MLDRTIKEKLDVNWTRLQMRFVFLSKGKDGVNTYLELTRLEKCIFGTVTTNAFQKQRKNGEKCFVDYGELHVYYM